MNYSELHKRGRGVANIVSEPTLAFHGQFAFSLLWLIRCERDEWTENSQGFCDRFTPTTKHIVPSNASRRAHLYLEDNAHTLVRLIR